MNQPPNKTLSVSRISELLDYATHYDDLDENTPSGMVQTDLGPVLMTDHRRGAIVAYKKVLGVLPDDWSSPLVLNGVTRPVDGFSEMLADRLVKGVIVSGFENDAAAAAVMESQQEIIAGTIARAISEEISK